MGSRWMKPPFWNRGSIYRWSTRLSSRGKSSTRPCLCRSSGIWLMPALLRWRMELWVTSLPHSSILPALAFSRPERA